MKKLLLLTVAFSVFAVLQAQEEQTQKVADDFTQSTFEQVDYENLTLPPLGTLFENAKGTPSVEIMEKQVQLQKKLLSKEQRAWLSFFNGHGSYTYGMLDNYANSSDVLTPIYYQYSGVEQHYWNIGGSVSIPFETLFDLGGKIKRQRLNVEISQLEKEKEYQQLKQQIAAIYVRITNNLVSLKTAAENAAAYRGAGLVSEQRFRANQLDVTGLADVKRYENEAIQAYQAIMTQVSTDILILEIMTNTPIITNINNK